MTTFVNFHGQFRGLVQRAMLSEIEDMLRIIADALRPVASDAQVHVERGAESLHAARRRAREVGSPQFRHDARAIRDRSDGARNGIYVPPAPCHLCGERVIHSLGGDYDHWHQDYGDDRGAGSL